MILTLLIESTAQIVTELLPENQLRYITGLDAASPGGQTIITMLFGCSTLGLNMVEATDKGHMKNNVKGQQEQSITE